MPLLPSLKERDNGTKASLVIEAHKNRQSFIETKPVAQVIEPLDN